MQKTDVKVGQYYWAKVSGKIVPIQIFATNPYGGWYAKNMRTKRRVPIHSARRLRGLLTADEQAAEGLVIVPAQISIREVPNGDGFE